MRALLIRRPWIDLILGGQKTWEIRGARTAIRGQIGLIASRSGTVIGVCDLVDCVGPLTAEQFRKNAKKAGMRPSEATLGYYRQTYAWVLEKPRLLKQSLPRVEIYVRGARRPAANWLHSPSTNRVE
jgi:hypothetical protein